MKKILRLSAVLLLIGIVFSAFASCGKVSGDKAIKEFEKLLESTNKFYSENLKIEATVSLEISGTLSDIAISSSTEIDGTKTLTDGETSDIAYYETATYKNTLKIADQAETVEEYTVQEGYIDNNMTYAYLPSVQTKDNKRVLLKSSCDHNEFKEYFEFKQKEAGIEIDAEHIEEITFEKNSKRKCWEITVTELTKSGKAVFEKWINHSAADLGMSFELKDVEIKMTSDTKNEALTSIEIKAKATSSSDNADIELVMESSEKYSIPDSESIFPPENLNEYKQTGDLRYRFFVTNEIQKLKSLNDIGFVFSSQSKFFSTAAIVNMSESDTVSLGNKNGKFVYYIDSYIENNSKGQNVKISYDGQTQKVIASGAETQSVEQSQYEAKSYIINNMFSVFSINDNEIKSIQSFNVEGTTVVTFTLNNYDKLDQIFNSMGIDSFSERSVTVIFTLNTETHELISAEYEASGTAKSSSTNVSLKARISGFKEPDLSMFE